MSYTALYRKWRPKTFDEVIGQEPICTTLKNQIQSGRIGHAYVFCGTRGTGKTSVAKIMARAVNCEQSTDGNPCNTCGICESILQGTSINVIEMDAASNNKVEDARDIIDKVAYPPTEGRYKVFIIDEAHMLTPQAWNALLKTIEEPPEYMIFIFATTEVNKIPVTILSRCQRYDFKRISVTMITERLKALAEAEHISIEDKALEYIAGRADGAMRDALSLLDECVAFHPDENITYDRVLEILGTADISMFDKLYSAIVESNTLKALSVLEETITEGRELGQFVIDILWYLRDLLIIKTTADPSGIIDASSDSIEQMKQSCTKATTEQLMRYIRIFAELSNKIRFSNQKRVLVELAIIKLTTPSMEDNFDSVMERLAKIEKRLDDGVVVTKASATPEKAKSVAVKKKVELPKAQYEDLMKLQKSWGNIVTSLPMGGNALLADTSVEPGSDNHMTIVFADTDKEMMVDDLLMQHVSEAVTRELGKECVIGKRAKQQGESGSVEYLPKKEDIEATIHADIEVVSKDAENTLK